MKSVELDKATAALKDYAEELTQEPIVVTRDGKAIALARHPGTRRS